jgi:hypothetical protein
VTQFGLTFEDEQLATNFKDIFTELKVPAGHLQKHMMGLRGQTADHDAWQLFEACFSRNPQAQASACTEAQAIATVDAATNKSELNAHATQVETAPQKGGAPENRAIEPASSDVLAEVEQFLARGLPHQFPEELATEVETAARVTSSIPKAADETPLQEELRIDPLLDNKAVTFSGLCDGHRDQDENLLKHHWTNLKKVVSPDDIHLSPLENRLQHVYCRKNAHVGSSGSWDLQSDRDTRKRSAPASTHLGSEANGQDAPAESRKIQKVSIEPSSSSAAGASHSQLALVSVTQLLIEAHAIDTNAGATRYKEAVQEATEISMTIQAGSKLAVRIQAAAYAPLPRTGTWMANTPSHHRRALKELISALGVVTIIEFLHAAIAMDTNTGSVACYRKLVERAHNIADAINIHSELPGRITAAAFTPLPRTGTWMPNTPSCQRKALSDLVQVLALGKIKHVLQKAASINTNHGIARYSELVRQAQDIADASNMDPQLSARIAEAAFKPLPRTCKWMSNTPSCHKEALKQLSQELQAEKMHILEVEDGCKSVA